MFKVNNYISYGELYSDGCSIEIIIEFGVFFFFFFVFVFELQTVIPTVRKSESL